MIYQKIRIQTFLVFLLALPSIAFSDWELVNDDSHLNFVSFKAVDFAEIHSFKEMSGSIDSNGKANLVINLDSLETLIPIRNERMRNLLFETQIFPTANFYLQVELDKYNRGGIFGSQPIYYPQSDHNNILDYKIKYFLLYIQRLKELVSNLRDIKIELDRLQFLCFRDPDSHVYPEIPPTPMMPDNRRNFNPVDICSQTRPTEEYVQIRVQEADTSNTDQGTNYDLDTITIES